MTDVTVFLEWAIGIGLLGVTMAQMIRLARMLRALRSHSNREGPGCQR